MELNTISVYTFILICLMVVIIYIKAENKNENGKLFGNISLVSVQGCENVLSGGTAPMSNGIPLVKNRVNRYH